jgi:hypothetical protein
MELRSSGLQVAGGWPTGVGLAELRSAGYGGWLAQRTELGPTSLAIRRWSMVTQ